MSLALDSWSGFYRCQTEERRLREVMLREGLEEGGYWYEIEHEALAFGNLYLNDLAP